MVMGVAHQSDATPPVAVVTGGTGFIGRHLIQALDTRGWQVRVCGRRPRPHDLPAAVDYYQADLAVDRQLDEVCHGVTHVFHLAGASSSRSSPEEMERVNVAGTERLCEAAARARVRRIVHVSTSAVYGKNVALPQPIREDVEAHPDPGYSETKWQAEQVVWRYADKGVPVAVLRPVTVYGPGAIKLLGSTILDAAIERFAGLGRFAIDRQPVELRMVHIDDVVAALLHLATNQAAVGRAFNLAAETYPTSHTVAEAVADEVGLVPELSDDPDAGLSYDERVAVRERMLAAGMRGDILLPPQRIRFLKKANPNNRLSLDALRSTGFRLGVTDLPASIRANVRWYRDHRWIL
jgi:nucleoside-diphosphate-sugar epimerase